MKPYLTPNPTLAFFIEWGVLIISILLVFSPFIYLGIRKWNKHQEISWVDVILSYIQSFIIYFIWEFIIIHKIDRYIYNNYINTGWLQDAVGDPGFKMIFIVVLGWPLLIFYSIMAIKQGKFTLKNFIVSLVIAIALFASLVSLWIFLVMVGLGYIGRTYF